MYQQILSKQPHWVLCVLGAAGLVANKTGQILLLIGKHTVKEMHAASHDRDSDEKCSKTRG